MRVLVGAGRLIESDAWNGFDDEIDHGWRLDIDVVRVGSKGAAAGTAGRNRSDDPGVLESMAVGVGEKRGSAGVAVAGVALPERTEGRRDEIGRDGADNGRSLAQGSEAAKFIEPITENSDRITRLRRSADEESERLLDGPFGEGKNCYVVEDIASGVGVGVWVLSHPRDAERVPADFDGHVRRGDCTMFRGEDGVRSDNGTGADESAFCVLADYFNDW